MYQFWNKDNLFKTYNISYIKITDQLTTFIVTNDIKEVTDQKLKTELETKYPEMNMEFLIDICKRIIKRPMEAAE